MKILHVINDWWFGGGAETVVANIINGLPEFQHVIALPAKNNPVAALPCEVFNWESLKALGDYAYKEKFDIIHIHWTGYGHGGCEIRNYLPIDYEPYQIITAHGNIKIPRHLRCHMLVGVSDNVTNYQNRVIRQAQKTIYNGVNTDFWNVEKQPHDKFTIIRVCRLDSKTPANLIDLVHQIDFDCRIWIVGYGAYFPAFYDKIRGLGDKRIKLFGGLSQKEIRFLYSLSDLCVYPVLGEGFGMSICEAMSCKVPVIASNIGGIPEIIEDPQSGTIIKDLNYWQHHIKFMYSNEKYLQQVSENARKRIIDNFSIKKMVDSYRELYLNGGK